jgi:hypothetical protein
MLDVSCGVIGVIVDDDCPPGLMLEKLVVSFEGGPDNKGGCEVEGESTDLACFSTSISSASFLVSPVARAAADLVEDFPCRL